MKHCKTVLEACDYLDSKSVINKFMIRNEWDEDLVEAIFEYHGDWFMVRFDFTDKHTVSYWGNKFTLERLS